MRLSLLLQSLQKITEGTACDRWATRLDAFSRSREPSQAKAVLVDQEELGDTTQITGTSRSDSIVQGSHE